MTELSSRDHEILDVILYLRHQLGTLLPEEQASELEAFLAEQLDDYDAPLAPESVPRLLRGIRKYEPVRARLEQLSGGYRLRSYEGPAQPAEEGLVIPLGENVVCPQEGHDGNDPYVTRLRKQGQRCPIHNVLLKPL
jgi:hypothetical protein